MRGTGLKVCCFRVCLHLSLACLPAPILLWKSSCDYPQWRLLSLPLDCQLILKSLKRHALGPYTTLSFVDRSHKMHFKKQWAYPRENIEYPSLQTSGEMLLGHLCVQECFIFLIFFKFYFKKILVFFLCLRDTERHGTRGRGRHRIRSRLHETRTHEPWDHDLSQSWMLNHLSHPGTPVLVCFN